MMSRFLAGLAVFLTLCSLSGPLALGQLAGSRAGLGEGAAAVADLPTLAPEIAQGYIAVDGRAVVRVRATEIRVVLAVTGEGRTAQECGQTVEATVQRLKAAWGKMGVAPEKTVVDFIAVLPRYQWSIEKQGDVDVGVEKLVGYRMQTNVHLAVKDEAEAQAALARAFEQGITDIIGFDYWSKELDEVKTRARAQALQAAQGKAEVLLGALFEKRPPAVNVQEQTVVRFPESLYHSFTSAHEESVTPSWRRDVPFVRAPRPRNTYYRGLVGDSDVQPGELPLSPEISVVSTVRLFFESPAAERTTKKAGRPGKKGKDAAEATPGNRKGRKS